MTRLQVATLHQALAGQTDCGDLTACVPAAPDDADAPVWLTVIDGLGHGPAAAAAAHQALACLRTEVHRPGSDLLPPALLQRLDAALIGTRGAAIGLARLQGARLSFSGIGNTRALRWRHGQTLRLPSCYGIVGDGQWSAGAALPADGGLPPLPLAQHIDLQPEDWLLMFTDGLNESLQIDAVLPEWTRHPLQLCQHLMARWRHGRDDAAVLVCHLPGERTTTADAHGTA